jgi:diacylglycerol kinase (ATP)
VSRPDPPSSSAGGYLRAQATRIARAFGNSAAGLRAAFREPAVQQWSALATVLIPLGLWLGDTGAERALLAGAVLLVILVELVNTAIETVVDRIGPERHDLSGRAKDIGSAAVLFAAGLALLVWVLVLV